MLSILHFTFLLLLGNIVKEDSPPVPICDNNEVYACGSHCTETCDYKPVSCIKLCRFGCFCQDGYVRQSNDTDSPCIKHEDCKKESDIPQCDENEVYQECGSACPFTCANFAYPISNGPKACIKGCRSGCFCEQGYYRDKDGQCVAPENCCKGDNEEYTDCGSACVETCDSAQLGYIDMCVAGCFCNSSDYVRKDNSTASLCIQREQCSK